MTGWCPPGRAPSRSGRPGSGKVRVGRETAGRKGSGVTVVTGVPLRGDALEQLGSDLKKKCGSGGTVKGGSGGNASGGSGGTVKGGSGGNASGGSGGGTTSPAGGTTAGAGGRGGATGGTSSSGGQQTGGVQGTGGASNPGSGGTTTAANTLVTKVLPQAGTHFRSVDEDALMVEIAVTMGCGNGSLGAGEQCDGANLGGASRAARDPGSVGRRTAPAPWRWRRGCDRGSEDACAAACCRC